MERLKEWLKHKPGKGVAFTNYSMERLKEWLKHSI